MEGLGGDDRYIVGNSADTVIEAAGGGTDRVYASVDYTLGANQDIEMLQSTAVDIDLRGNALTQSIIGDSGDNGIDDGGAGASDVMRGLGGNDRYYVNNGLDKVLEGAGGGTDRVYAAVTYALTANQEVETLTTSNTTGTADIALTGNDLAQAIAGNGGDNIIDGGGGNDTLTGRSGSDTFRFDTALDAATNVDRITDFSVGTDIIELSHAIFSALSTGPLSANAFYAGTAAHAATDRIVYNAATGALSYDADGSGAGASTQFARLSSGLTTLDASSFKVA